MSKVITVHDAKTHFSKYLDRALKGEEIRIGKYGKPMVKLVPDTQGPLPPRKLGQWSKLNIWVADDFDEPMTELWNQIANR